MLPPARKSENPQSPGDTSCLPCADLDREALSFVIATADRLLHCETENAFHTIIADIAAFLDFEFILYAYKNTAYALSPSVNIVNLSNPVHWMEEYHRENYLACDPIRIELERRLRAGELTGFIHWDAYDRELSDAERNVIERRRSFGLTFGCSLFVNSDRKDSIFLLSLSSRTRKPDRTTCALSELIVGHLNSCRKRLDLISCIGALSEREKTVAEWMARGSSNAEIAQHLQITESTVKFHATNIFKKLRVPNRQSAISVVLAAQYLS